MVGVQQLFIVAMELYLFPAISKNLVLRLFVAATIVELLLLISTEVVQVVHMIFA